MDEAAAKVGRMNGGHLGVGCNVQFVPAPPFEEFREQIAALGAFICRE
jgi:hypothetical protein